MYLFSQTVFYKHQRGAPAVTTYSATVVPRWDKRWNVSCDCAEVWCVPSANLLLFKHPSRNKDLVFLCLLFLRGSAGKSLARPGRKQVTATKLGIYSTHSPRSSIHFSARCSNFCKPLKKMQKFVRPTRSPRQQWPPRRSKNGDLSIVFSVQGTDGSATGPDPESRVGDQDIGSPGRPVSSGLQVPGDPGHCRARTRPLWWPSRGVFFSKMSVNCTSRDE